METATKLSLASLRSRLRPGIIFSATWIGPVGAGRARTAQRVVVSQSSRVMQARILDGPQVGDVIRLEWVGVRASECGTTIILADDYAEFLEITTELITI